MKSIAGLAVCVWVAGRGTISATPLISSADLIEGKSWSVAILGQSIEKDLNIQVTGVDAIQIPISGGGSTTIFSTANAEIETEQESDAVVAQFSFRPREGLQYQVRFGQIQNYKVEFSSGSSTNKLDSLKDGFVWGLGLGGRIAPGSIVSTAISWNLDYNRKTIDLDRFTSADATSSADIRLEEEEFQGSINFSRRWKMIEPYGGVKILRTVSRLLDNGTKGKVSGTTDGVSPYIGLQWSVADREMFLIEGSFVDEEGISAAWKIQF